LSRTARGCLGAAVALAAAVAAPPATRGQPLGAFLDRLGAVEGQVELAAGEGTLAGLGLRLRGLSAHGIFAPGPGGLAGRWRVESIRDARDPARWAPLWARGRFAPAAGRAAESGRLLQLEAVLADAPGTLVVELHGRHAIDSGRGRARVRLRPLRLTREGAGRSGGASLRRLAPGLQGAVVAQAGSVEATGEVRWDRGALEGGVDVVARDLALVTAYARVQDLDADVRVEGPEPLTTPPGQTLSVARIDPGLPLEQGRARFQLLPEGVLVVESAVARLAGGRLRTSGRVELAAPEQRLVLAVEGVELDPLLAHLGVPGLTVTGVVFGSLPVIRSAEGLSLDDGHLETRGSGWIRYEPPSGVASTLRGAAPMGGEALVRILRDFRYEALEVRLTGDLGGTAHVRLHLAGANPDYRDGHPVELNLDLEVDLGDLLRAQALSREVPEQIEEHLRRREEEP